MLTCFTPYRADGKFPFNLQLANASQLDRITFGLTVEAYTGAAKCSFICVCVHCINYLIFESIYACVQLSHICATSRRYKFPHFVTLVKCNSLRCQQANPHLLGVYVMQGMLVFVYV